MKNLGFITSEEDPRLTSDDRLCLESFKKVGFNVEPVIWDHTDVASLADLDGLIFRSCWNYHRKQKQFIKWLGDLKNIKIPVWNSVETVLWNMDKKYLLDLSDKGIAIPKTQILPRDAQADSSALKKIDLNFDAADLVIKPAVSLSGHDTYKIPAARLDEMSETLGELVRGRDILIQEFIPQIIDSGELSLFFFGGNFSHAVRKIPAQGEFRVQSEYGGRRQRTSVSGELIQWGHEVLGASGFDLLYGRVDLVEKSPGVPVLMELEIIDPMFYFEAAPEGVETFTRAATSLFLPIS